VDRGGQRRKQRLLGLRRAQAGGEALLDLALQVVLQQKSCGADL
jgi:hypothetical protein